MTVNDLIADLLAMAGVKSVPPAIKNKLEATKIGEAEVLTGQSGFLHARTFRAEHLPGCNRVLIHVKSGPIIQG